MKAKFLFGFASAMALPVVTIAAAPFPLGVSDGQYALVPACRFAGAEIPVIGGGPSTWEWLKFNQTNYVAFVCFFGVCSPDILFSPGEGAIIQPSGGGDIFLFQQQNPPKLPLALQPGFNLICCQTDINASFEDIVGKPPDNGVMLYKFNLGPGRNPFNLAPPDYTIYTFSNGAWSPTNPVVGITEAVFVFQPPQLTIIRSDQNLVLTWPTSATGYILQSTTNLASPAWTTNLPAPVVINGQNTVTNLISGTQQFFRLSQ